MDIAHTVGNRVDLTASLARLAAIFCGAGSGVSYEHGKFGFTRDPAARHLRVIGITDVLS